jgi:hypothetical protein
MIARLEMLRLVRSRRPLITLLSLALFLGLMLIGFYTYARTETGGAAEFRYTFENRSYPPSRRTSPGGRATAAWESSRGVAPSRRFTRRGPTDARRG